MTQGAAGKGSRGKEAGREGAHDCGYQRLLYLSSLSAIAMFENANSRLIVLLSNKTRCMHNHELSANNRNTQCTWKSCITS